jgi:hypothetical protein
MSSGLVQILATVTAAAAAASVPPAPDARLAVATFPSVLAAIEATLTETDPVVIGFGEWHQTSATAAIEPTLRRFNRQVLPTLAPRLSHLVVETWMTSGRCGAIEEAVTRDIARSIDRPAETENDIADALRLAHAHGAAPRVLSMSCDAYRRMQGADDAPARGRRGQAKAGVDVGVDYDSTLRLTGEAIRRTVEIALLERARSATRPWSPAVTPTLASSSSKAARPGPSPTASPRRALAVYGGALHNDVYPLPGLGAYSYARAIRFATLGRYVEIDLVIPEYAGSSPLLRAQDWWGAYRRARRTGAATRIRRGSTSYVIVFPPAAPNIGAKLRP